MRDACRAVPSSTSLQRPQPRVPALNSLLTSKSICGLWYLKNLVQEARAAGPWIGAATFTSFS